MTGCYPRFVTFAYISFHNGRAPAWGGFSAFALAVALAVPLIMAPFAATAAPAAAVAAVPASPAATAPPTTPQKAATPQDPTPPASDPLLHLLMERGVLQAGFASLQPALILANQARDFASEAVIGAMAFLGLPYTRGGSTAEGGFDCSGFTRYVFKNTLGLLLPRSAEQQAQMSSLQPVAAEELRPGDLVFFNTVRKAFSHVGIYVGDGRFVHSPREGAAVRLDNMSQSYWATRFDGARRAPAQQAPQTTPSADSKR